MATPVFEEFDPASDCECPGCVQWRGVRPYSGPASGTGPGPARTAVRRTLVVAAAASTVLGAGHALPAAAAPHAPHRPGLPAGDQPDTPQGGKVPLHGPSGKAAPDKLRPTTRTEIVNRARNWVAARVPYSMSAYWGDGYRQDCSGFVSMAWNLVGNEWTGSLNKYGVRIHKEDLQPGDILLFHNPADPQKGSHVVIFGGWTDYTHTYYTAYEETRPHARRQATPYAYWSHSDRYQAYRYKGLAANTGGTGTPDDPDDDSGGTDGTGGTGGTGDTDGTTGAAPGAVPDAASRFPGARYFGPGANNKYVTQLGRMLVERGGARFYTSGPGPRWSDADRRATRAFQQAQGWTGTAADGFPGPRTWALLVSGTGRDIGGGAAQPAPGTVSATAPGTAPVTGSGAVPGGAPAPTPVPGAAGPPAAGKAVPEFPGRGVFRPGSSSPYVVQLGKQLVKKGFGRYYATRPGPRWSEADRRAVQAFQRAQGWRGGAADGYPGPETWRRLFSS